ncbi:hypothetical protein [Allosalinactinospora lopnorensis]|uniref:hypothetical protein n=1 Tax=Allosalinactinospora lopnorensis TaxID=1352348 RepID=UPI000623E492|nr:hypothetical protein [Allosalinactinospora lopnorensis]
MNTTDGEAATLARLNLDYPGWHCWRTHERGRLRAWCASNKDPGSDRAPTLHGDTADQLEAQLKDPPRKRGRTIAELIGLEAG